jgi:hypothetical protein
MDVLLLILGSNAIILDIKKATLIYLLKIPYGQLVLC